MSAPLFRDPIHDGATDPAVIQHAATGEWWMFYTQRRPRDPEPDPSVRWVHGSRIGAAVSRDQGRTWCYRGTGTGLGHEHDTLWAPEVIRFGDEYRMFVTVVEGIPSTWTGRAFVAQYRSDDLEHWQHLHDLDLGARRTIDAAIAPAADGWWRLWYKNEDDGSSSWSAISPDLDQWTVEGCAVPATPAHEGPNVFRLGDWYWMVTDEWRGLGVHRSADAVTWHRQVVDRGLVLAEPGSDALDRRVGHHADVVVAGDGSSATIFYFTHPSETDPRPSAVHAAVAHVARDRLLVHRDVDLAQPLLP